MFEALRGLRDAVAPESGNLGNNNNNNNTMNDAAALLLPPGTDPTQQQQQPPPPNVDELWVLFQARDEYAMELTRDAPTSALTHKTAFVEWFATAERQKDSTLVETLAQAVLRQSAAIDAATERLLLTSPSSPLATTAAAKDGAVRLRTRAQQLQRLEELIRDNAGAAVELEDAHARALERRNQCRQFVLESTSRALGMAEQK